MLNRDTDGMKRRHFAGADRQAIGGARRERRRSVGTNNKLALRQVTCMVFNSVELCTGVGISDAFCC